MSHVVSELMLVKDFIAEAERQLDKSTDFGNGNAVSLAQDAIELLLRIVVRERGIPVDAKAGLEKLTAAIDKAATKDEERVPHAARVEDLNKARVGFKHAGIAPSRSDAIRLIRWGLEFLEVAFLRFFAIEFRQVSIAHQIRSAEIRALLLEAEARLSQGQYLESLIEAADAVNQTNAGLGALLPPISRQLESKVSIPIVTDYMKGLRLATLAALVGFDPRELARFKAVAPGVLRNEAGSRLAISPKGSGHPTEAEAQFGLKFATEFALAVQTKLE